MSEPPAERFAASSPPLQRRLVPIASVMLGSLAPIVPVIAGWPMLPPFGLMLLIGWRLLRPDALRIWLPVPLGLFDDLVSGQPLGSAMLLWTTVFFAIELFDQRLVWRDFLQDWLIAAGAIGFCLIGGRLIASPIAAHVDTMVLMQICVSILLYPALARLVGWLDRRWRRA